MTEEEIEKRIIICEKRVQAYLEVGNARMIEKYENEISKWEKLLSQLKPKIAEELINYQRGYIRLSMDLEKVKDIVITCEKNIDPKLKKQILEVLERDEKMNIEVLERDKRTNVREMLEELNEELNSVK